MRIHARPGKHIIANMKDYYEILLFWSQTPKSRKQSPQRPTADSNVEAMSKQAYNKSQSLAEGLFVVTEIQNKTLMIV